MGRSSEAQSASRVGQSLLTADPRLIGLIARSGDPCSSSYHAVIEIRLDEIEPQMNGPSSPDKATTISSLKEKAILNGWPFDISAALIGSCTNSSYEDMQRAASIVRQAIDAGLKTKVNRR